MHDSNDVYRFNRMSNISFKSQKTYIDRKLYKNKTTKNSAKETQFFTIRLYIVYDIHIHNIHIDIGYSDSTQYTQYTHIYANLYLKML